MILTNRQDAIARCSFNQRLGNYFPARPKRQATVSSDPNATGPVGKDDGRLFVWQTLARAVGNFALVLQAIHSIVRAGPNPSLSIHANTFQRVADHAQRHVERADEAVLVEAAQTAAGRDANVPGPILANAKNHVVPQAASLGKTFEIPVLELRQSALAADPNRTVFALEEAARLIARQPVGFGEM